MISIPSERGSRGRRRDVVTNALSQLDLSERAASREAIIRQAAAGWIARRAADAGFGIDLDQVHVAAEEWVHIPREQGRPIVFSALTLQGGLTVTDPTRFIAAIVHGFGAAKAFGCGLMLIRRG